MRLTHQREEILSFLRSKRAHYNAVEIYDAVRERIPNISLGTVYRNLGKLVEDGEIITVETDNRSIYYDGYIAPHTHFVCKCCSQIFDFEEEGQSFKSISDKGFTIDKHRTVLYGTCTECNEKN
ncbi:MAG: transcriptional repressor [Clostridia bacterium]|nr:transcriptional repressor [Clostridia bacterium]